MTDIQQDIVLHLLREGSWREAVQYYAEEHGVPPAEAADFIQTLAKHNNIPVQSVYWIAITGLASLLAMLTGWVIARPF